MNNPNETSSYDRNSRYSASLTINLGNTTSQRVVKDAVRIQFKFPHESLFDEFLNSLYV